MSHRDKQRPPKETQPKRSPSRKRAQTATARQIREILNRTQIELARALGVSEKAVQSYEQGWRTIPIRVMIQLLVLLALYRRQTMKDVPCWKIRRCKPEIRKDCPGFTVGLGQFCWFIGAKNCVPDRSLFKKGILPCMNCDVIKRLLRGPQRAGGGSPPTRRRSPRQ
jgi:DNA-binding transcriptional regulator YiaG